MLRCQGRISVGLCDVLNKKLFYPNVYYVQHLLRVLIWWCHGHNIAISNWIINTEVFLWEIQNGEIWFSIFVDKFPYGLC